MALFHVKILYRGSGKPVSKQRVRVQYHDGILGTWSNPQYTNEMGITSFECGNWRGKVTVYVKEDDKGKFNAPGSVTIDV